VAYGVVRRPKWPFPHHAPGRHGQARRRPDPGHIQGLGTAHGRQELCKPTGQEGLSGPRRPDHEEVVAAGGRDLQSPQGPGLTSNGIDHFPPPRSPIRSRAFPCLFGLFQRQGRPARQVTDHLGDGVGTANPDAADQRSLSRGGAREDHGGQPRFSHRRDRSEGAAHGFHPTVQPQLTVEAQALNRLGGDQVGRGQEPHRDGEVQRGSVLAHVRRRQVHRDPPGRDGISGVGQAGEYALPSLPDHTLGKADDGE
jgi:hypothetical protein